MSIIAATVLAIGVAALVLFPEVRHGITALGRGFLGLFVKDMAKTPEGAKAIYETAIREAEEKYNKARAAYNRVAGELDEVQSSITTLTRSIDKATTDAETLYKRGLEDDARVKAGQRAELMADLKTKQQLAESLMTAEAQAKGIFELCERNLRQLKADQKKVVNELQAQSLVKDIMTDIDELSSSSAAQRLINSTTDYLDDLRKENRGAMVVHASKVSTRIAQADQNATKAEADDFIASMAAKYGRSSSQGTTASSH